MDPVALRLAEAKLRTQRRMLLIAGGVYLGWWFVVQALLPHAFNPLPGRLAVVAIFFAALALSYGSESVRARLDVIFVGCAWLLTAHYYYLLHGNRGDTAWAVGAYVVVFAVAACLPSRRSLITYCAATVLLGLAVALLNPVLLHSIFLPGLLTMALLSVLTLHNRILLEQERADRERVDTARAVAEAGVALRDEFISIASHELRTPLAALQLSVQGLGRAMKRDGGPSPEVIEKSMEIAQRQTVRLAGLVERLLDASQMSHENFSLRVEKILLVDLVREVTRMLEPAAKSAGSAIEIVGDPGISGSWDRLRLEQVVGNLLRNAIAYGSGRPIKVTVSADTNQAHLAVADEGIGVPPEHRERIFDRFERAVPVRNYGGMGLGLYIARRIVEAHGGHVHVESGQGSGSIFIVDLPLGAG